MDLASEGLAVWLVMTIIKLWLWLVKGFELFELGGGGVFRRRDIKEITRLVEKKLYQVRWYKLWHGDWVKFWFGVTNEDEVDSISRLKEVR